MSSHAESTGSVWGNGFREEACYMLSHTPLLGESTVARVLSIEVCPDPYSAAIINTPPPRESGHVVGRPWQLRTGPGLR